VGKPVRPPTLRVRPTPSGSSRGSISIGSISSSTSWNRRRRPESSAGDPTDINLLLHAYNREFTCHAAARRWWEALMNGTGPVGPGLGGHSWLRAHLHAPHVLRNPLTVDAACAIARSCWRSLRSACCIRATATGRFCAGCSAPSEPRATSPRTPTLPPWPIEHQASCTPRTRTSSAFRGLRWTNP